MTAPEFSSGARTSILGDGKAKVGKLAALPTALAPLLARPCILLTLSELSFTVSEAFFSFRPHIP
jgi:hypothetical protein